LSLDARVNEADHDSIVVRGRGAEIQRWRRKPDRRESVGAGDAVIAVDGGYALIFFEQRLGFSGLLFIFETKPINIESVDFADNLRAEFGGESVDVDSRARLERDDEFVGDFTWLNPDFFALGQALGWDDSNDRFFG